MNLGLLGQACGLDQAAGLSIGLTGMTCQPACLLARGQDLGLSFWPADWPSRKKATGELGHHSSCSQNRAPFFMFIKYIHKAKQIFGSKKIK
ncbi:hypothetical protein HYC85_002352 [Camellia sinensis]|uniref:Uncharacterized protein n=1 Tax=Camellia sinensis TaxID=4442 RepID=A0A7J7I7Z6_CAMSI|nr:hypothetical protein HYC85_002352 [Camellia sinensis]